MNAKAMKSLAAGAAELGITLTEGELQRFDLLGEELKKWNKKINLTAITDDDGIAVKHFVDSLTLFKALPRSGRVLDIGSGAGFPCIPAKIVAPGLDVLSVDAGVKKISFQKHVARTLSLSAFEALHVRAETLVAQGRLEPRVA